MTLLAGSWWRAFLPRPALALAVLGIAVPVTAAPALAQDMVWRGRMLCDAAPTINLAASNVPATVRRDGSVITLTRSLLASDGTATVGEETGRASLAGNDFVVETAASIGLTRITGRYQGTVAGDIVTLNGRQTMSVGRSGSADRACSARLSSRPG